MTKILSVESIIANYFDINPEINSVSLETISDIAKKLITLFKKENISLYVDNTRGTLLNTLITSPDLFKEDKEKEIIFLKNRTKLEEEVKLYFNPRIDRKIRETYLQLMENFKKAV